MIYDLPPFIIAGVGDVQNVPIVESQPPAGQPVVLDFIKVDSSFTKNVTKWMNLVRVVVKKSSYI